MSSLEIKLALQEQIYVAMHKLCQEDHLSKAVKKSRIQQFKREEKKLKELQEALFIIRLKQGLSFLHQCTIVNQGTKNVKMHFIDLAFASVCF